MKRRLIKQGHSAVTLTLPGDWIKRLNLKPKDEVDIIEEGNQLIINAHKNGDGKTITIDISNLNIPLLWKYISTVYRNGYEEIILKYENAKLRQINAYSYLTAYSPDPKINLQETRSLFSTIQSIIDRFIGIEIIDFKKDYCIIKQMEEPSDKQFDNSLRRIFLLIDQLFENLIISLEKKDFSRLEDTHLDDTNLDKFYDFCCRVMNKTGTKTPQKSQIIFTMLFLLELLGDEFKKMSSHLLSKTKIQNLKATIKATNAIKDQFNNFKEIYYKFDKKLIKEMYDDCESLFKEFSKDTTINQELLHHLRKISEYIYSLTELRIELEYGY